MSLSMILSLAISIAVCIVVIMAVLGGMNVASPIARYAGIGVACFLGVIIGQLVHRKFFA